MGRFQNLRDEGGFAQTPQPTNSRAVAHKRERIDSPLAFCSDIVSNRYPNIKYGVNSLKAKEKTFSNRYKVRMFFPAAWGRGDVCATPLAAVKSFSGRRA